MQSPNIVVVGTGMAGFGATYRLHQEGITPNVYDKNPYYGGHTASFRFEGGYIFDVGPHISYTKDKRIEGIFAESVDQRFESDQIRLNNYWHGYWPLHPVQVHLNGLPEDLVVKVIGEFIEEQQAQEKPIKNYADWLYASFGKTFAENFPMQYTRKFHTTIAENMSTDWLGPRIYRPSIEEVLRGALSSNAPHEHYVNFFRYPTEGGFQSFMKKFVSLGNLNLNHEVVSINLKTRRVKFSNGNEVDYDALISSVPLPDLIPMIESAPENVVEASKRLACSSCVLVSIVVDRENISPAAQMTYFYDEDFCFSRLHFPHMLSAKNVPKGMGSIQAEVYFSNKYKPLTGKPEDCIEPVLRDLHRSGLLRKEDKVVFRHAMIVPFANIIFDLERAEALKIVHAYLDEAGIFYCGRYGEWGYLWTDESFKSGEQAAGRAIAGIANK
jgi:protoporphyrinogen oxidase